MENKRITIIYGVQLTINEDNSSKIELFELSKKEMEFIHFSRVCEGFVNDLKKISDKMEGDYE